MTSSPATRELDRSKGSDSMPDYADGGHPQGFTQTFLLLAPLPAFVDLSFSFPVHTIPSHV
jgi:hypothetical protein